jgi:hypothetical protein
VFSKNFENVSVLLKRKKLKKYFLVKRNPKIHFKKPHDLNQKILKLLKIIFRDINKKSCFSKIYTSKKSLKRKNARYARAFILIGRFLIFRQELKLQKFTYRIRASLLLMNKGQPLFNE